MEHGLAEKITVCAHTNHDPNKQEVGFIFVWSDSELWSLFKYSKLKLKNQPKKLLHLGTEDGHPVHSGGPSRAVSWKVGTEFFYISLFPICSLLYHFLKIVHWSLIHKIQNITNSLIF
jgi:hypothetical protein